MSDVHAAVAPNMRLTEEQLVRFKTDGILILYGLLDPDRMRAARERVWAATPPGMYRPGPDRSRPSRPPGRKRAFTAARTPRGDLAALAFSILQPLSAVILHEGGHVTVD